MHLHFFAKLFSISQFSFDHKTSNMSRIEELEPEYLQFIKRKEHIYGTPIVFTKPHEFDKLKAYVEAIDNSWKYELNTIANFITKLILVQSLLSTAYYFTQTILPKFNFRIVLVCTYLFTN